ncbi:MAG: hypothetical protein RBR02_06485 [Desulfuromonadaceae bacterium]|nr:hypothetical protein [Desulfuromonadaceae bacterium]
MTTNQIRTIVETTIHEKLENSINAKLKPTIDHIMNTSSKYGYISGMSNFESKVRDIISENVNKHLKEITGQYIENMITSLVDKRIQSMIKQVEQSYMSKIKEIEIKLRKTINESVNENLLKALLKSIIIKE